MKPASLSGLRSSYLIHPRDKLRLVCRIRGIPPPIVLWFKDGQDLQQERIRRIRIQRRKFVIFSKTVFFFLNKL